MDQALLKYPQAAKFLNMSERKLADLVKTEAIRVVRPSGSRMVRFSKETLREWIRKVEEGGD